MIFAANAKQHFPLSKQNSDKEYSGYYITTAATAAQSYYRRVADKLRSFKQAGAIFCTAAI